MITANRFCKVYIAKNKYLTISIAVFDAYIEICVHIENRPRSNLGRIHSERHLFARYRVLEFELARPKAKRTFALVVIAILLISDDGIAHIGQLNSYLVSSSRYEIDENEAYVLFGAKHFIIELGVFCAFGECGNDLYGVGIGKLLR